jgi:hypothetical protein
VHNTKRDTISKIQEQLEALKLQAKDDFKKIEA